MKNSVIASGFNKFFFKVRDVFENSLIYKTFKSKDKKSKSKIVRAAIDDDLISHSKAYQIIKKTAPKSAPNKFDSKILNSLFKEDSVKLPIFVSLLLFIVSIIIGASLKISISLFILTLLTKFTQVFITKKWYKSSLIYRFFKYAYTLEEKDE